MTELNARKSADPAPSSDRSFGVLFAVVFATAAGYTFYTSVPIVLTGSLLGVAGVLTIIALFRSELLAPFNKAWSKLGVLLGRIVSPVVLAVMFFFLITPVALVLRAAKRDVLKLRIKKVNTHWVERNPVGPNPDSFKNQF